MSPVPVDPFPDFIAGAVANPDQVDARFLELYKTLDPAQRGIDGTNVRTGGLFDLVSALPASPRDGQECHYLADATNGVLWHLRYRAASPSIYKWECVGGEWVRSPIIGTSGVTGTGFAYGDLAGGAAPSLVAPLAGDYAVKGHAEGSVAGAGGFNGGAGVTGAAGPASQPTVTARGGSAGSGLIVPLEPDGVLAGVPAATTLMMRYLYNGSSVFVYDNRSFRIRPIRVG